MNKKELGIYIHIPFCKAKCYYCDFTSYTNQDCKIESYIREVDKEMSQYDFNQYNITTIYIGGGTPSYIDAKYVVEDNFKSKEAIISLVKKLIEG